MRPLTKALACQIGDLVVTLRALRGQLNKSSKFTRSGPITLVEI